MSSFAEIVGVEPDGVSELTLIGVSGLTLMGCLG